VHGAAKEDENMTKSQQQTRIQELETLLGLMTEYAALSTGDGADSRRLGAIGALAFETIVNDPAALSHMVDDCREALSR
tara:strand:- start:698 stop:934 length:237 start_codon:yes stop_codon:yes gene_type:complete